ncbi:MAG: hypothetical protein AVDCRST_MAG32-2003, partial [uncultured Nocardioides sp.]
ALRHPRPHPRRHDRCRPRRLLRRAALAVPRRRWRRQHRRRSHRLRRTRARVLRLGGPRRAEAWERGDGRQLGGSRGGRCCRLVGRPRRRRVGREHLGRGTGACRSRADRPHREPGPRSGGARSGRRRCPQAVPPGV